MFVVSAEAIHMIEKLPSPVIVIAAIGDAKGDKSTALNFILHSISYDGIADTEQVKEVFKMGNTMGATKHGVWISDVQINGENDRCQSPILYWTWKVRVSGLLWELKSPKIA